MRHEARNIARDRANILTNADAAGLFADDPGADHRKLAGELRQRRQGLAHIAFSPISATCLRDDVITVDDQDIGALARVNRLLDEMLGEFGLSCVAGGMESMTNHGI